MVETNIAHESRKRAAKTIKEKEERKATTKPEKPVYKVMNGKIIQETMVNGNAYRTYLGRATRQNLDQLKAEGYTIG